MPECRYYLKATATFVVIYITCILMISKFIVCLGVCWCDEQLKLYYRYLVVFSCIFLSVSLQAHCYLCPDNDLNCNEWKKYLVDEHNRVRQEASRELGLLVSASLAFFGVSSLLISCNFYQLCFSHKQNWQMKTRNILAWNKRVFVNLVKCIF